MPKVAMHFVCIAFVAKTPVQVLDDTKKTPDPFDGLTRLMVFTRHYRRESKNSSKLDATE